MAEHTHAHKDEHEHHGPRFYFKIYLVLLVLLVVSIIGPELNNRVLTLITAFGIAIVKALMVAAYFMHLKVEKKYIWYMLYTMLLMVFLFFLGTAADVMKSDGNNWTNESAHRLIDQHKGNAPAEH
ncbi:MAG TPA: cytochrome C oxidase subunit IV family protein [Oligoflexus sp.]|uniref:cytochrome C oxidase subunit IV family protein n=1 Tax=Oligoflexus sp. TaxID=1971216 RepID=UPI002D589048|nr:cytochrome C oxidase subunit IV family protein [Oligoflexus sp.]HYX37407.1 cytochrome C oxidase subunit IV family protein [Oligoflexus sp.]